MTGVTPVEDGKRKNIYKPDQEPALGCFVYALVFISAIGGLLFGYDTGVVSSAMLYVPLNGGMKPLSNRWKEYIVSFTPGFACVGALLSGPGSDYFGRRKVITASSAVFTIGAILCTAAPERGTLLAGRIILGLAIGFASMIVPIYIGEASPAPVRGRLVNFFQMMITIGFVLANVFGGIFSYANPENVGWRLMFAAAAVPAVVQFIGFLFLPESPRWLLAHGKEKLARKVLFKVYSGREDWVDYETNEIKASIEVERKLKEENAQYSFVIFRILQTPHVLKALAIGSALQAFQQLCGVNTVMFYTGTIIKSAGISDNHITIWISCAVSMINFLATFIPMFCVERIGRRLLLLISVAGVVVFMTLLGVGFLLVNKDSVATDQSIIPTFDDPAVLHFDRCATIKSCDLCVTQEKCGFCRALNPNISKTEGYCRPAHSESAEEYASTGYCAQEYSNFTNENTGTFEWDKTFCKTKYTALPIVLMVFYMAFYAAGFGPMCWVLNAEFYPLWARSTCVAIATFVNWICNLLISLTYLTLSQAVTKYGAFFVYAGISLIALIFFFIFVPETKRLRIEEVELLFMPKPVRKKHRGRVRALSEVMHKETLSRKNTVKE